MIVALSISPKNSHKPDNEKLTIQYLFSGVLSRDFSLGLFVQQISKVKNESNCSAMSILIEFKCLCCHFEGASAIEKSIVLPGNICIERANVVDIDVAVWLRHKCRVTD